MADLFGASDPYISPPEQASSTLGAGQDPSHAALLNALAQIQQLQQQPLVPNNPMAQLGVAFQGYASGYQGQSNPAIQQAMAQRAQQTNALAAQATIATHLATLQQQAQKEERQAQQHKTDAVLKIAQPMMASEDPNQQRFGGQMFIDEMKRLGYQVPPDAAKAFGTKSMKPADINEIGKLLLPGADGTPGMAPEAVASLTGRPLEQVKLVAAMPDTPQWRSSIGAKTNAVLAKEDFELTSASVKALKDQYEWMNPELNTAVHQQFKLLNPTKRYIEGTEAEQKEAVRLAVNQVNVNHGIQIAQNTNEILNRPMPAAQKDKYIDPNTYRPIRGELSQAQADAAGLPSIDDPQTRRSLPALKQLSDTTQRVKLIHERHPEYWPPSTGNMVMDQVNLGIAKATMMANMNIDPDLGKLKALMADVPKLAVTAGASARFSNFIAEVEKNAAGWDQVATKESKMAQLNQTIQRMTTSLTDLGLNPPPRLKLLPNGKEVWVPWNARIE